MYYLYSLLTAPGVAIHELAHAVFCLLSGVKIHRIKLFQFGPTAGYVVHDEPEMFYQALLISLGPLIINSLLAMGLFSQLVEPYGCWQVILFGWLGIAIGLHAIPSTGDAQTLLSIANRRVWRNPLIILGYPFVLAIYILNLLKRLHIDIVFVALLFWLGRMYLKG
ncbi:MAG: metalloprotease family protein [Candidatus Magasanikbacteria bacterium]